MSYSGRVALAKPGGKRALDRILSSEFVSDVDRISLAELRERRLLVDHEEAWLSYLRRMLHGRIDILEANLSLRRGDEGQRQLEVASFIATLVDQIDQSGRPLVSETVDPPGGGRRYEERLLVDSGLDEYEGMSDEEIERRRAELRTLEREVSEVRRMVHDVHDALTGELARRYRTGEASPRLSAGPRT